jgi:tyrosyl-tRNA synthetase
MKNLLWRGLIKDVSNEDKAKKLLNEEKLNFTVGLIQQENL